MKRASSTVLVLILTLLSIFFASCEVSRDEPHTKAYLTEDSLIATVNGRDIVELTKPTTAATLSSAVLHIKLTDGEFQNLANDTDVTDQWIYPIENRNLGLRFITKNVTLNSVDLYVSGTAVLSGIERFENDVKVNIPARYILGRNTSVSVEGDKKAKIKVYGSNDRVGFVVGNLTVSVNDGVSSTNSFYIRLVNTQFNWVPNSTSNVLDATSWFSDLSVLNATIQNLTTSSTQTGVDLAINSNYAYLNGDGANPIAPTDGSVSPSLIIPKNYVVDDNGNEFGDLECISYATYEIKSSTYAYIVKDVTIEGVTELSEVDTLEEKDIVVGLVMGTFNNITNPDVSSLFYNAPQGLKFTVLDNDNLAGKNQMTIRVSGTPLQPSSDKISFMLGSSYYTPSVSSSYSSSIWVDSKNSFYSIKPGDFYSWNLYDLATFSGTRYDITTQKSGSTLTYLNDNRNMTKTADGSDITFDDQYRLSYGATREVTFTPGLSRKGYRLKGFAVQEPITQRTGVFDDNKSYINTDIVYTSDAKSISFTLDEKYKGEPVNLFAIWEADPDSIYFKPIDTVVTVTKAMIDEANPTGDDNLKDLKHHDGTALESDYKQELNFIALPGGIIGGTDDSPEYYKWPVSIDTTASTTQNGIIKADFAMADIPLTAALWNVVYAWATSADRGENVYKFDLSSSSPMLAGVLYSRATSTSYSRNSVEDPIVRMTWYNALIFANAFTEWYNNVVLGEAKQDAWLTVVYTDDSTASGKVLRDAMDTTTLDKINPEEISNSYSEDKKGIKGVSGATGFRLPTLTEWQYAASVYPESDWNSTFKYVSYPQILNYAYASGLNEVPCNTNNTASVNPKLKDYAVWSGLYRDDAGYGTQTVGKYFKADKIRTNGAKANFVGLYDMCGNVWEWSEDWTTNASYRFLSGGSWYNGASNLYVGFAINYAPVTRYYSYGVRFCRTLSPKTTTK